MSLPNDRVLGKSRWNTKEEDRSPQTRHTYATRMGDVSTTCGFPSPNGAISTVSSATGKAKTPRTKR